MLDMKDARTGERLREKENPRHGRRTKQKELEALPPSLAIPVVRAAPCGADAERRSWLPATRPAKGRRDHCHTRQERLLRGYIQVEEAGVFCHLVTS